MGVDQLKKYTVIGYVNEDREAQVAGVIEGEHAVGQAFLDRWNKVIEAESEEQAAGTAVEEIQEKIDTQDEDYDFPWEDIDDRFTTLPNPSDPTEADHWEYDDAVKQPLNNVWTVVTGDSSGSISETSGSRSETFARRLL